MVTRLANETLEGLVNGMTPRNPSQVSLLELQRPENGKYVLASVTPVLKLPLEHALTCAFSRSRNRPNGATHTFRRPSANTTSQTRDTPQSNPSSSNAGVYIPPHLNSNHPSHAYRNGMSTETRYSREQLLDIFQNQKDSDGLTRQLDDLFQGSWDPISDNNGISSPSGRGEKDQYPGPEVCWNYNVDSTPFGLIPMTEDEKQVRVQRRRLREYMANSNHSSFPPPSIPP